MPSLLQLPPEILTLIYTELLTNNNKEFWPQLRKSNRTCNEAEIESDILDDYLSPFCESHAPKTRPCLGEIVEDFPYYNACDPDDFTDQDVYDEPIDSEDDNQRPSLGEQVRNALRYNAPSPSDTSSQHSEEDDDPSNDAEASEDEVMDNDYDTSSLDSIATVFPNTRPFLSAAACVPPPQQQQQHRQCTNHYFLHPAILSTNSHVHVGAAAVLYGLNAFHFALDFDFADSGDGDEGLSNAPWARHWGKMRDVHLTQNCAPPSHQAPGRMQKRRRNAMTIADRDHWGDEEFRDDLCGVVNGLLFLESVGPRFSRLRVELGNEIGGKGKVKEAPSTAVLFDQLTKAFASLNIVKALDIRVTARAMQAERWKCLATNVARLMNGQSQIVEEDSEDDKEDAEAVRNDKFCKTRFVITPQGKGEGDEVTDEVTDEATEEVANEVIECGQKRR